MSTLLEPEAVPWSTHPGWGIAVDLLPREVQQGRRVRVVRRLIGMGLLVLALACIGVVLLTTAGRGEDQRSYDEAQAETARLRAEAAQYADVTAAAALIEDDAAQAATLLAADVDVVDLIGRIRDALPNSVTISNIAVQQAGADDEATTTADGDTVIGTITISGTGPLIRDLAPFVAALNHLDGLVDVVPGSTTQGAAGMSYSLSANFTDALLSHRHDLGGGQ